MKKTISVLGCALFAGVALLPLGVISSFCFGYMIELANYPVFAVVTALLAAGSAAICAVKKETVENKAVSVLLALTAPLSLINAVLYLLECSTALVAVCMLVCVCCCCCIAARYGKPSALKIVGFVLSALMVLPVCCFAFIALIFGGFARNTVVQSVTSPNGTYYAEVIDNDQGALGGNTLVDVYENEGINALIFKISKKPQRVYQGKYGEFKDMIIYWKDENCLVIDSVEYIIK